MAERTNRGLWASCRDGNRHCQPNSRHALGYFRSSVRGSEAIAVISCAGYSMKVAGWRLVESNGGNAETSPALLPPQSITSAFLAIGLSAIAVLLLVRRAATPR
jgi:hypothetical protein